MENYDSYITDAVGTDIRFVNNQTTAEFDRVLRTNLYAPFFINRAAVPFLPPGSSILFTTSGTAINPLPYGWEYSGSKAAVNAMAVGLARQLIPLGIRVNAVAAGLVYSPFLLTEGYTTELMFEAIGRQAADHVAQPVEIAPLFVNIVDDSLTYTSGSVWGATSGLGL